MRYQHIDILRGICIFLMILFHWNYILIHIFDNNTLNISEHLWYMIGKISALGFMFLSGISFFLAREKYGRAIGRKYVHYSLRVGVLALSITGFTYLFIPEQLIIFGILHLFAVSFFVLSYIPKNIYLLGVISGLIIFFGSFIDSVQVSTNILFPFGLRNDSFFSADYYPIFPYFGVILSGYIGGYFLRQYDMFRYLKGSGEMNTFQKVLSLMGKKALIIYMIHVPILYGMIYMYFLI